MKLRHWYRFTACLLAVCLAGSVVLTGCNQQKTPSESASNSSGEQSGVSAEISGSDGASQDASAVSGEDSVDQGSAQGDASKGNSTTKGQGGQNTTTKKPTTSSGTKAKTIYVKNYGAKGDGKTDDGSAIFDAICALREAGSGSTLVFESNKTYYAKSSSMNYILYLNGASGLTVDGKGSTILVGSNKRSYMEISNCSNVTVKNLNFDYKTKPAFLAKLVSLDAASGTAVMTADRDIGLDDGESFVPSVDWFGVLAMPTGRYHMWIDKYEMVSKSKRQFRVYFGKTENTRSWMNMLSNGLICPMPFVGHMIERGFTIAGNTNFTMQNCNIYACARFGFLVTGSEGTTTFDNVNFKRANNALDSKMDWTSWRDGWHCKENRGKLVWKNCTASGLYDDVFNISSSTLYVKEVNSSKTQINLYWPETNSTYTKLKAGDALTVINTSTGEMIGRTTVKRVVKQSGSDNIIVLNQALPKLTTGTNVLVCFDSMVAPGSSITNCNFDGTYRFRGPLTVTNSTFNVRRMWIDLYGNVEGPIPRNILFKNCVLKGENTTSAFFHIGAYSKNTSSAGYHVENIVFQGCTLSRANFDINAADIPYVKFQ